MKSVLIATLGLTLGTCWANDNSTCRVRDPELQGQYQGGCNRDGLADGQAIAVGSKARYEGQFRNGKKHGVGKKTWFASGDSYEGRFDDDFRHGWGKYTWGAKSQWYGESYEGDYVRDQREGYGVYFWANGDKFAGQWRANLRYGESYMEKRRKQSLALLMTKADTGTPICKEAHQGLEARVLLRGTLRKIGNDKAEVVLDEASEKLGLYSASIIPLNVMESSWTPCN